MPGTPETILAFDFGLRRIGVAVGQQVTRSARPLETVANGDAGPDWRRIAGLIGEWRPDRLVVGMPRHADGSDAEMGSHARAFAVALERFELPVNTVDERHSSQEAEAILKSRRADGIGGRITKAKVDAAAATLIAERWLKSGNQSA